MIPTKCVKIPLSNTFAALALLAGLACSSAGRAADTLSADQQSLSTDPKIQLAILLDTSGSMDGLIDQARNQLWQAVNEFAKAKRNGVSPILEVAVYEYGNDGLSAQHGHTRQVIGLTRELDKVSEALFALTTNGGNEYCGYAIETAVGDLNWSASANDIKAIFIAGNEPFTQGPIPFKAAIDAALDKDITVNTIHAGSYQEGAETGWMEGARLASGNYMSIDHNHQIAHVVAPQDRQIAELNAQLNQTYIPYGTQGLKGSARQQAQDLKSHEVSPGLLSQRIKSKVSSLYSNANWDLVDALDSGAIELEKLDERQLPAEMQTMDREKREDYIQRKAEQRKKVQNQIVTLSKARDAFVATQKRELAETGVSTLNDALTTAVREQGEKKQFDFQDQ